MRIGFFTPSWPGERVANGITTATVSIVTGLRALGHEVYIVTPKKEDDDPFVRQTSSTLPPFGLVDRIRTLFGAVAPHYRNYSTLITAEIEYLVAEHDLDVFVMEESFGWAGFVQDKVSIPIVVVLHGPHFLHKNVMPLSQNISFYRDREACEGEAVAKCAAVIAPSKSVLESTIAYYDKTPAARDVFPNPMKIKPQVDQAKFGTENPLKILFVGRFDTHKGGDVAIDAFRLLAGKRSDVMLTFVGPDSGVPAAEGGVVHIEDKLSSLPEHVRVRINNLGPQDKSSVDKLRLEHPCTIVPSRFENFSATLTEAMASGSAVIASDVGGLPEILTHEETGLLVPPGDAKALADALGRLAADRSLALRFGAAARDHIDVTLAPEIIAENFVAFLQPVIDRFDPQT